MKFLLANGSTRVESWPRAGGLARAGSVVENIKRNGRRRNPSLGYQENPKVPIRKVNHVDSTNTTAYFRSARRVVVVNFESSMVEFLTLQFT